MNATLTSLLTACAALVAVLALIWLAARLLRASKLVTLPASQRSLAVREILPLDAGRRLYLIGCQNRAVLLLTGSNNDVVVGWLPTSEEPIGREKTP